MQSSFPFALRLLHLLQLCLGIAAFSVAPHYDSDTTKLPCFDGSATLTFNSMGSYPFELLMGESQTWRLSFRLFKPDDHNADQPKLDSSTLYDLVVKGKTTSTVLFCHKPSKESTTDFEKKYPAATDYEYCQVVLDDQTGKKSATVNQIVCTNQKP